MKILARAACAALLAAAIVSAAGCSGYRLGSMLPKDIKTVYVPTFANLTREPNIEVDATQKFIQELQRDGSLQIAAEGSADATIKVEIRSVELQPLAFVTDERTQARQYRLWISAAVVMRANSDNRVIAERSRVRGQAVFNVSGDLTSSKQTAYKPACTDLAHSLLETLVEIW